MAAPSRRESAAPVRAPLAGSRAIACMPPQDIENGARDGLNVVAAGAQLIHHIGLDAALHVDAPAVPKPGPRGVDGGL